MAAPARALDCPAAPAAGTGANKAMAAPQAAGKKMADELGRPEFRKLLLEGRVGEVAGMIRGSREKINMVAGLMAADQNTLVIVGAADAIKQALRPVELGP